MNEVTYIGAGTPAGGTGAVQPGLPAGWQAGDIFILLNETNAGQQVSPTSGWNHVPGSPIDPGGSGLSALGIWWRRATSSESAPTVADGGNHQVAVILAYRGCRAEGNPWDVVSTANGAESASPVVLGATTTVDNCLVLACVGHGISTTTGQLSSWANAALADFGEVVDIASDAGGGGGIGVAHGLKATAGSFGNSTVTLAGSARWNALHIALAPEAPEGGPTYDDEPSGGVLLAGSCSSEVVYDDAPAAGVLLAGGCESVLETPVQRGAPMETVHAGGYTDQDDGTVDLHLAVNEETPDHGTFVISGLAPDDDRIRVRLRRRDGTPLAAPDLEGPHGLRWYGGKNEEGGARVDQTLRLYQGGGGTPGAGSLIAEDPRENVAVMPVLFELVLEPEEILAITDYADLYAELASDQPEPLT